MKKILITGAAGHIGYFLAHHLLKKDENTHLVLVDNFSRGRNDEQLQALLSHSRVEFKTLDLAEAQCLEELPTDVHYIYHLAAIVGVRKVLEEPDRVAKVNVNSTIHVLEHARRCPRLKRLLFSSTSEVYAGTQRHYELAIPTAEDTPIAIDDVESPRSSYAISKIFGENLCYNYQNRYQVPITIVRYHNVYGPRMGFLHVIPELFCKLQKEKTVELPSATHTRAFCFVEDAVEATVRVTESPNCLGQAFHVGTQKEISIRTLVDKIACVMGKKPQVVELAPHPGSPPRRCPNTEKLKKFVGFDSETPLSVGLAKTFAWYAPRLCERYE